MCKFVQRCKLSGRINSVLLAQFEKECSYWRKVLKRVVATVKLLSSLRLPLRGHDESALSNRKGNFLIYLEYLSEFDDFLKEHFKNYRYCGSGKTKFLTHQTIDEFISIMAEWLRNQFNDEVKDAKYYSIIVDLTPDVSYVDQLTLILRYVTGNGEVVEQFLGFVLLKSHTSECLETTVLEIIANLCLDIKNCRGQSFDNAANMAGKYSGLQARLNNASPSALFIPRSSPSLNLICNAAAESCKGATHFFDFVQNMYAFFPVSTHWWNMLQSRLEQANEKHLTVKRICDTRWSACADAVLALKMSYDDKKKTLLDIGTSNSEKLREKTEAKLLAEKFEKYNIAVFTLLWNSLLQRINAVSKLLQKSDTNLLNAAQLLASVTSFVMEVRNDYSSVEAKALTLTENIGSSDISEEKRKKTRKLFLDETRNNEINLKGKEIIIEIINVICDTKIVQLQSRSESLKKTVDLFCVFFDRSMDENAKSHYSLKLSEFY
ncbi:zinc finger MYM-type containing 1 [Chelydra serpentina]|uniref:Zinc finger MYM-type containing 1 n=1 Tax=Chelydra serpentina TaxID=8475 RepID=A0A8T1TAX3_CHESE|nr:zinc finger MYM-type containing 1 [Chelydra serpentina]